ncbi:MAG: SpoIIE family protein phosphatase [Bacteroidales bacterium]|nr:SpoIIE family protein phosphatase [Bacteroidales bacterium]
MLLKHIKSSSILFRVCFLLLLPVCGYGHVQAQVIPFINYTMKDGLVQSQVSDICQDKQGYIWFATAGGVSRFDGRDFKNYTVSEGLPVNTVTTLLVDEKSRIWMATSGGGLAMYDGKIFQVYTTKEGLASNSLDNRDRSSLLLEDSKGNIWCRTEEGVSVVSEDSITTYNTSNGLVNNSITCFIEDKDGRVICGTENMVSVIDDGKIQNFTIDEGNEDFGWVLDIIKDSTGEIWIIGRDQMIRFSNGEFTFLSSLPAKDYIVAGFDLQDRIWLATLSDGLFLLEGENTRQVAKLDDQVLKILEDSRNNIWLLTPNNGIYKYKDNMFYHYDKTSGLVADQTVCVFEDTEGNIWIGTNNGISMYGKVIFETFLPEEHVISISSDKTGNVWGGLQNKGLVRLKGQELSFFESNDKDNRPGTNNILCIEPIENQLLLGARSEGMGHFINNKIKFDIPPRLSLIDIYSIIAISENEYWVATSTKGLGHIVGEEVTYYATDTLGLADDFVKFLERDSKGRIWCGTALGLSVFDGEKFTTYTTAHGLPNNSCTDIAIDKYGSIWLGTEDGLCKITETADDQFSFRTFTTRDGLTDNSITVVHSDNSETLWVAYNGGLNAMDLKTNHIRNYGLHDGFSSIDCYYGAAATDIFDNVWFGTIAGLVKYSPREDRKRDTPPRTYITGISLTDGTDIWQFADTISSSGLPENLSLPYNKNGVRIDWIGIHFTIPAKNKYRYILEGYEKNWHEGSSETFRDYQLSHGKRYTFKVVACNNDGVWNPEPVTYSFYVRPPWWATTVAYIIYAVILFVLIYLYVKWRERALIEKNRQLEEKVTERTIEIERQKQNILEINTALEAYQEELIIQRDMAAEQRDQIAEQRQEIMDSIHYAKRIQNAIMPSMGTLERILSDYFLFFRPRDVVSGDFYWAAKHGNKSVVVAADCTGHGVPGALMSMLGISILNEIVLKQEVDKASEILDELRVNLKLLLSQTGAIGEQKDGMDVALCIIDYDTMTLQYAGAYNSLYLVRRGELIEYKADKMPVGIHIGAETHFSNHMIPLEDQDMLYIFSDGYVDQFGGANDSKFKTKPFKQLLVNLSALRTDLQKDKLSSIHDEWKGENAQVDDILVIGIRVNA